jgi:hypothetical protein
VSISMIPVGAGKSGRAPLRFGARPSQMERRRAASESKSLIPPPLGMTAGGGLLPSWHAALSRAVARAYYIFRVAVPDGAGN